ncbi:MAG: aminotransferase class III-fold pyridoxal phosphate-dependent enzyme [Candidatus Marinimicrobia bacterium]|jgi:4-aminobutyrate aminotransferase-like enzyme|nr:aminotransferase class III-fold pyridoxal phosphate-dependent enzyme [Candidatus Neomarinimicrobiota bacterium]MDP6611209.1 aminotransferase class III-fold pyridoxal phosphate-dependent enzyme [Candidatus Neomarinimicrobiota bacterium]|tara:strand:+ start:38754 stop:40037 length:1284 start_codon:yes stop_codon:yes gene_type:complete
MLNREQIGELRGQYLGPSYSVSYKKPLHIVRGEGQYLFEVNGKRYLDAVNNIQHVGHCHPKVVEAAQQQYEQLNTNTRYLDETIINYAKDLTDKLPDGLDVCFFTNSGSESNDLALRIARHYTQSKETIVLDAAYHGNLSSLIEISPYKHDGPGGEGAPGFVHTISMPDAYRGKYRGEKATGGYVNEVQKTIQGIQNNGEKVPVFIAESLMGCGGQLILPKGFLKRSFELVRESGGICIADEVQIGFGRMGSHFWGFETCDVIPDIITMGKSMGNGHPLSAVVTTREIADAFNNGMEYFNSFGGNPVSCAVGQAVLNVIEKEGLQQNSKDVGGYLLNQLDGIEHPLIGEVRGRGLFIGVELVKDRGTLTPAAEEADEIINRMKDGGILMSTDGPDRNVLKIKPPVIFTRENADELVFNLTSIFDELS